MPSGNLISDTISENEDFMIVFLGKELFFSNQTLRNVQNEFGVAAHRFETLDAYLSEAEKATSGSGKILVVDQILLDDLLTRPEAYAEAARSGCLAFAYRKEEMALTLFNNWLRDTHGPIGYLPMNIAPDAWRAILRLLMHEELYLPGFVATCMTQPAARSDPDDKQKPQVSARSTGHAPGDLLSTLTPRELQVLELVSQGKSNKAIAAQLGITEHTVKLHVHNVSGKIGVSNRTAAAHFYFEAAPQANGKASRD